MNWIIVVQCSVIILWLARLRLRMLWHLMYCMRAHTHIYQRLKTGCYLQIDPLNLRATKNMQHRFIVMRILNTPVTFIRSRMWISSMIHMSGQKYRTRSSDVAWDPGWRVDGNRTGLEAGGEQLQLSIMAIWTTSRVYFETKPLQTIFTRQSDEALFSYLCTASFQYPMSGDLGWFFIGWALLPYHYDIGN